MRTLRELVEIQKKVKSGIASAPDRHLLEQEKAILVYRAKKNINDVYDEKQKALNEERSMVLYEAIEHIDAILNGESATTTMRWNYTPKADQKPHRPTIKQKQKEAQKANKPLVPAPVPKVKKTADMKAYRANYVIEHRSELYEKRRLRYQEEKKRKLAEPEYMI